MKSILSVGTSKVAVVAGVNLPGGSKCTNVHLIQTETETKGYFNVYDANQNLIRTVPDNQGFQFTAPLGSPFAQGQTVGYVATRSGTVHFLITDHGIITGRNPDFID